MTDARGAADSGFADSPDGVGERIYRHAEALAFPRYPGTEGDERAIRQVAERLRSADLKVGVEPFSYGLQRVWWLLRLVLLLGAAALLFAGFVVAVWPGVALGALALAMAVALSLLNWSPWLERLYAAEGPTSTANVVATTGRGATARTVIVLAHHDSKSQNLTMLQRGALTIVALLAVVTIGAIAGLGLQGPAGNLPSGLGAAIGGVGALALVVLSTLRSGNASPGGVDNAGSLAILLELAETLPGLVDTERTELIFLSPGAEEDHMVGAMRWLERHSESLEGRPVIALNMDGVGAPGRLVLLERFGFGRRFSPLLSRLMRQVAEDQAVRLRGVLMPPAMGIDAIPFVHRGIECLTLSSGSLDRATMAVHSQRDRARNLSPETLERGYRLAVETVRRLSAGTGAF